MPVAGIKSKTAPTVAASRGSCILALGDLDTVVEWGGALRWIRAPVAHAQALRDAAQAVGGQAMLFRRARSGITPWPAYLHPMAESLQRIERALRAQFDPAGVFSHTRLSGAFQLAPAANRAIHADTTRA